MRMTDAGPARGSRPAADPTGWARQVGWVLLPVRAFLGFTFLYAGISKIGDRSFLDDDAATSLHSTVVAVRGSSPIGGMLGPIESHSALFGVIIAIAETAVGLGVLTGLLTRIAAAGGMVLSFGLFLTVSWNASPWYTGADIVYVFALSPLALGGSGGVLSLDGWLARVAARESGARGGSPGADRTRRGLLAAGLGLTGLVALGLAALARGSDDDSKGSQGLAPSDSPTPPTPTTPTSTPATTPATSAAGSSGAPVGTPASSTPAPSPSATGAKLVAASSVPVGGGKLVTDPKTGDDTWVLQLQSGEFTAYSAVCPHQGCTVAFESASEGFACPCHDSTFSSTGKRLGGPAPRGLTPVDVVLSGTEVHLA
jgi:thiosulfate dehydrogenase [quinone] large subunit